MRRTILALLLVAAPAFAHDPARETAQVSPHNPIDCWCRAQGRIFAPGESICLSTAQGPRLASCEMVTNVMSWVPTERSCPEA